MAFSTKAYEGGNPYLQQLDYNGTSDVVYLGWADPGTATSAAKWQVRKMTYSALPDGSNGVVSITWMGGSNRFDQIWDNRATAAFK